MSFAKKSRISHPANISLGSGQFALQLFTNRASKSSLPHFVLQKTTVGQEMRLEEQSSTSNNATIITQLRKVKPTSSDQNLFSIRAEIQTNSRPESNPDLQRQSHHLDIWNNGTYSVVILFRDH